jgi:hypothetical protein
MHLEFGFFLFARVVRYLQGLARLIILTGTHWL